MSAVVPMPPLFVSHGAPDLILHDNPTRDFLAAVAATLPRPTAIVSVSAHFASLRPAVVVDAAPAMIYDFGGFDPALREMVYPAPGEPALARRIGEALVAAGHDTLLVEGRGYDHGTWVPLKLMYPAADVPVVQLSVQPRRDAAHHFAIGRALAPLVGEGVLILGSGSLTHNLHEASAGGRGPRSRRVPPPAWVTEFAEWIAEKVAANDVEALLDYRARAPHAVRNHPTDEHLLPLFVALGAGGDGMRIHEAYDFAVLAMDAYRFEVGRENLT
ncbi:MAG: dioxygenase [Siculibacillus sp.]|nr:dioxygenase [Siculibacillus sp.]